MRSDCQGATQRLAGPMALSLALLSGPLSPAEAEAPVNGQWVGIIGQVTGPDAQPLPDVTVELTAYRRYFSFKSFEKEEKDFRRVDAVTDERGEYRLRWLWDDYFNRFELRAGVFVPGPEGEKLHVLDLQQLDLGRRVEAGLPVVSPLVVDDTAFLDRLRRFEGSLESDDEQDLYHRMGLPDEVKVIELAERTEISWWYFERGKVYRFGDGKLLEEAAFDPVVRTQPDNGEPRP